MAGVGPASELGWVAGDRGHLVSAEPRVAAEDSSGPALTLETVADRDPYWLALTYNPQLSTIARCAMSRHKYAPLSLVLS